MKRLLPAFLAGAQALLSAAGVASSPASLIQDYRDSSTPSRRAAIENYARAHSREKSGALAWFALGIALHENKDFATAAQCFAKARPQLPELADYIAYYRASAEEAEGNLAGALEALNGLRDLLNRKSLLLAKATIIAASDMQKTGKVDPAALNSAIQTLRERAMFTSQPEGDYALALAYDALHDEAQAATYYQRVYFLYPATQMAALSWTAIERLHAALGQSYPPPLPQHLLERGQKWIDAKEYGKARAEFQTIIPMLGGVERDQAKVRIGEAMYAGGDARGAYSYLKGLDLPRSEADAERWYWISESARRMNNDAQMMDAIKELGRHHERSVWRLKALVSAANKYLVSNEPDKYEPLYRAAANSFPADTSTAYCHWKITWNAYMARKHNADDLLREQVEKYPADFKAATALYYLGRMAENENSYGDAKAYYSQLTDLYPNFYYGVLARERLAGSRIVAAAPSTKVLDWLGTVEFPSRADYSQQTPNPATEARIQRIRLLVAVGLTDFAETETRYGARVDGQPHLLAMEIAQSDAAPHLSLRHMKALSPDYLSTSIDKAPKAFWRMLFPLPYQSALVGSARRENLDPYMVAALIRQESEFNPGAHSHANAYGLTQIVPATGRMLARQQGIQRFSPALLYQPDTNLRLGTSYMRSLLDQWNGKWEQTLASYNAGKSRVVEWLTWGDYREPAEFVESIPFTETREYVQAVIRNAALYRQVYGAQIPDPIADDAPFQVVSAPATVRVPVHKASAPLTKRRPPAKARSGKTPSPKNRTSAKPKSKTRKAALKHGKRH
jgi:soluble lytic murein transglycosylase